MATNGSRLSPNFFMNCVSSKMLFAAARSKSRASQSAFSTLGISSCGISRQMATNVLVECDDAPLKRTSVKATPAMPLKSVLAAACSQLAIPSPELYALKYKKQIVDLSLSIRFANIPQGAKLLLVRRSTDAPNLNGNVDIAIQIEDGRRLTAKFPALTTLWNILRHFENASGGSLNLTKQTGQPQQPAKSIANIFSNLSKKQPVYIIPVCVLMNQEYASINKLKTTTLADAGLVSGNAVIRVIGRFTNEPIDAFLAEIESDPAPQSVPTSTKAASSSAPKETAAAIPSASQTETKQPDLKSNNVSASTTTSIPTATTSAPQPIPVPAPTVSQPITSPQTSATDQIQNEKPAIDLDIHIYAPPPKDLPPVKIDLPSSFYELSPAEMRAVVASSQIRTKQMSDAPLMTRAMRDREDAIKRQKHPKTMIRVRFPDRTTLQATFWSGDTIHHLYDVVQQHLKPQSTTNFVLYVTPPHRELDPTQTFWESHLAPATLVYFGYKQDPKTSTGFGYGPQPQTNVSVLSESALAVIEPYPIISNDNPTIPTIAAAADTTTPMGEPAPASSSIDRERDLVRHNMSLQHMMESTETDIHEDNDNQGRSSATAQKKYPKWFRPISSK